MPSEREKSQEVFLTSDLCCITNICSLIIAASLFVFQFFPAGAGINNPGSGSASPAVNTSRVTININEVGYANLIKGFGFSPDIANQDANGNPVTTPTSSMTAGSTPSMPFGYYGTFVWKWSGTGSMNISGNPPVVVSSGGTSVFEINANAGDLGPGNFTICTQAITAIANPRIVFAFGWNIQSISNGSGLIRINTKTNFVNSGSGYGIQQGADQNGNVGKLVQITGANANTGANGTWAITNLTASSFDLVGSTFTNAQAGVAGTGIFASGGLSISIVNRATFSGFSNVVWARSNEEAAVDAGQLISNDYIAQLQYVTNPGSNISARAWLRMMDFNNVQSSLESDFDERLPATYLSYPTSGGAFRPDYYVGTITNGGSDNYTASNPTHSGAGSYQDQEIVQGKPSATNTGGTPTLAITGRPGGAKPIYYWDDGMPPFILGLTAGTPTPGTDVLQYTFSATWFNGGAPYVFNYTTVAGDNSLATLNGHLATALSADSTLSTNKVFIQNPLNGVVGSGPYVYPRTAMAGRMTITYSSGPAISVVENMRPSIISTGNGTFVFNSLLDGWIYRGGGLLQTTPLEVAVEMANRSGNNIWWTWPITKGSWVTSVTQFFGDPTTGLTIGLRFGGEVGNELWNSGAKPYAEYNGLGMLLGWNPSAFVSNFSYAGLRTAQFAQLMQAAWSGKGRGASDLYVFSMHQLGEGANGNFDNSSLKGTSLNSSTNTIYGSYGGLNGSGAPTAAYNTFPNRPVDYTRGVGQAPYFNSKYLGSGSFTSASQITGTVAQNISTLQAAKDYVASGLTSTAFTALTNQFNRVGTVGPGSGFDLVNMQGFFTLNEAMVSQYDGARPSSVANLAVIDYEAAPTFGIGSDGNSGVNSVNNQAANILSADISALGGRMTTLGWDVSPYTQSGTNNTTEMATMVLQMLQGWKFDVNAVGAAANTSSYDSTIKSGYYQAMKTTSATREAKPAQYGMSASNWGWQPVTVFGNTPYQNYNAMHEWNAGN